MEVFQHYDFLFVEQSKRRLRELQSRLNILLLPFTSRPCYEAALCVYLREPRLLNPCLKGVRTLKGEIHEDRKQHLIL